MARKFWFCAALASLTFVLGCGAKKPPKLPDPVPEPEVETVKRAPPPPKKKKCESFDEACKALAGTKARVPQGLFTLEPPMGWLYAQLEGATVAKLPGAGPCVAVAAFDSSDTKAELKNREAALEAVAKEAGLTLPKQKVVWKRPADKKDVHGLKVRLWQVEGAMRSEKKGPLLVFEAVSSDGKTTLVGVGFVPSDEATGADEAIMQSIESIEAAQ